MLLIPTTIKRLKDEGRKEGIEQGIERERAQWVDWLRRRRGGRG